MALFTRKIVESWCTSDVFERALKNVRDENVMTAEVNGSVVSGLIRKQPRAMKSKIKILDGGQADNLCPCRDNREMGIICWHAVALCLEILRQEADPERQAKLAAEKRRAERLEEFDESAYLQRAPEGTRGAEPARLRIGLGPSWESEINSGDGMVTMTCAVALQSGAMPIGDVPQDMTLCFNAKEDNLLYVIEDICEGPARSSFPAKVTDLVNVISLLPGGILYGPNLRIGNTPQNSRIGVELDVENGGLVLYLSSDVESENPYTHMASPQAAYVAFDREIQPLAVNLPGPLQALYSGDILIERDAVPRFLKTELPVLQHLLPVDTELSAELLTLRPSRPSFRLALKGSPASLAAVLYAVYPTEPEPIEMVVKKPDSNEHFAIPEADDMLAFRVRNPDAEKAALESLKPIGLIGDYGDNLRPIIGTRLVANFLASELPRLRRRGWKVDIEGRAETFIEEAAFATPIVDVRQGGSGGGAAEGGDGGQRFESSGTDWFEISFDFETSDGSTLSAIDIQRAINKGDSYVERDDGSKILFDRDAVESMTGVFRDCSTGASDRPGAFKMSGIHAAYVKSSLDALDGIDVEAPSTWTRSAEIQNRDGNLEPVSLGEPLDSTLRPYQKDGVNWLRFWEVNGYAGILADEMGLGKTLQTLCWLQLPRARSAGDGENAPALIVCPTSLVENWIAEGKKFTPGLKFLNITGAGRKKVFGQIDEVDVAVTSYGLMRRDLDELMMHDFSAVVLDEAQHIKNPKSQNAKAAKRLRAETKLVLTGTPVENRVTDLWSIMDFLMPGYLGNHDHFQTFYEKPISRGGSPAGEANDKLRRKLHPFLLRRLKRDVAKDLPPKIEQVTRCNLTPDQKKVYKELLDASRRRLFDMVESQGFNKSRMEIFKTLLRLRQVCCHLDLLKMPDLKAKAPSAKLELFQELLNEAMDGGHRMLVFSQFTSMLGILRDTLNEQNIRHCYLDGSTKKRLDLVNEFNGDQDIPVFLISLKAGGTGLNLTGADMVLHFDPWWNPAAENQATDRAYRIGQKRTVVAHKLITNDTVEEKVLEMQERKKRIIDATLTSDEQVLEKLSWDDVQDLLSL